MYEGSDSETESNIPLFYIHSLNECLPIVPRYAEDFMEIISEEMRLWPNLEYPGIVFDSNAINVEKKVARHKFFQSFILSLNVKSETPIQEPTIYGIVDAGDSDPIQG